MVKYIFSYPFIVPSIKVLILVIVCFFLNMFLRSLVKVPHRLDTRKGRTYISVLRNLITLVIIYAALHVTFLILGINIVPLLASAGVLGIIIGIGSRSLFEDLIAGFFLLSQSRIALGDYIKVGTNIEGTIINIGFKNIELRSPDGSLIIVPNGQINSLINTSYGKAVNTIDVPVKSGQKIDVVLHVFEEVLASLEKDDEMQIFKDSKVFGIANILAGAVVIRTIIITPTSLRGIIDEEFRHRLLKDFQKHKLLFA